MRDLNVVDEDLRVLAGVRSALRKMGCRLRTRQVDELLDERNVLTTAKGGATTNPSPKTGGVG